MRQGGFFRFPLRFSAYYFAGIDIVNLITGAYLCISIHNKDE